VGELDDEFPFIATKDDRFGDDDIELWSNIVFALGFVSRLDAVRLNKPRPKLDIEEPDCCESDRCTG